LGQEVVEVAVPLFGEDNEALGTIRYGLSTRRMHLAIAAAKADARAQQLDSIKLIGLTVALATLMGILLSRMQAVRITLPVRDLTRAATDLARGDRNVRVKIESGDELELLGFSFNRMVLELATSYDKLEELNRNLEHKVEERTVALARRNDDMRAVLDNVDQGLITVTPNGRMAPERSAVVDQWFGRSEGSPTLWQFLEKQSPAFALQLEAAWQQIIDDVLPLEVALYQLPKRLTTGVATYDFRYLPLLRAGALQSVLVVAADVTSQLLHEREEAESRELVQAFHGWTKDRLGFLAFLQEANGMMETIANTDTAPAVLTTTLHTLKGNAASLGLAVVAKLCHRLEDALAAEATLPQLELGLLQDRWQTLNQQIAALTPSDVGSVEVPQGELVALISVLERSNQREALERIRTWRLAPVSRSLARLAEQARGLGQRLGKGELEVEVAPTSLRLDPERFGPVFSALVHVMRNAVDHGIETRDDRVTAGKQPNGRISLRASPWGEGAVMIEIADDGRGMDPGSIREKASALNLPSGTSASLLEILCHEGFTTRNEVTETSGRGVGMSAVKRRIEDLGGRIELQTAIGRGTTWRFFIPISNPNPSSEWADSRSLAS
jgi:two-component system chemotaxis sensor kinase CheA